MTEARGQASFPDWGDPLTAEAKGMFRAVPRLRGGCAVRVEVARPDSYDSYEAFYLMRPDGSYSCRSSSIDELRLRAAAEGYDVDARPCAAGTGRLRTFYYYGARPSSSAI